MKNAASVCSEKDPRIVKLAERKTTGDEFAGWITAESEASQSVVIRVEIKFHSPELCHIRLEI